MFCLSVFFICLKISSPKTQDTDTAKHQRKLSGPVSWPMKLRKYGSGYAVTLGYQVNSINAPKFTVPDQFVLKECPKGVPLRFEDLKGIRDHLWRLPIHPQVFRTYPQAINVSDTVNRLLQGRPIEEAPINNVVFRYSVVSKSVCHPDHPASQDYDVVVVVKSGVTNFQRRENFRRIYRTKSADWGRLHLGQRIGIVFSVGLRVSEQNILHRGGRTFRLNPDRESANEILQRLEEELVNNDDLIVGEYEDNYFNLTMKMQYSYIWVATFCQRNRPIVLFLDDDGPFSDRDLAKALYKLSPEKKAYLFHGIMVLQGRVYRYDKRGFDKWGVSKSEVPWPEYPPYPFGVYVLMSYSNVQRLALGMLFTKFYHIDDTWLGLTAARMSMHFRNIHLLISKARLLRTRQEGYGPIDWQWSV
ncbi:beta 13 n galactosyltransferase [Echinococcus multilocularis]|uniref:Hexosyltransferase n=1 Tax=Echinococcus multilocularis TaxID=6211 RepID=A0A068YJ87_ECHMU|nr:beta 13 n galactosyltransferase [Echinococcus multilocularis]